MADDKMLLPKKLTAENGAKYALIGEFFEGYEYVDCDTQELRTGKVPVRWDTIKRIWDRAVRHFEDLAAQENERMVAPSEVPHEREPKA